ISRDSSQYFQGNVVEFAGCSVAVDVSCLLHRGLFGCMESVAQGKKTNLLLHPLCEQTHKSPVGRWLPRYHGV
ncbi:hypothetical protein NECAME_19202, partial [Necator americanus]